MSVVNAVILLQTAIQTIDIYYIQMKRRKFRFEELNYKKSEKYH